MDKLILYFAPKIIGGRLAPSFVEGTGITKMQDAIEFKDISFTVEKIIDLLVIRISER